MTGQTWTVNWYGRELTERLHAAAARGIRLACEHILKEALRLVPTEDGDLAKTGRVQVDEETLTGVVYFGTGLAQAYAVIQHEDMTLQHDSGRGAKYLENAFNSERRTAQKIIRDEIRRAIGSE